MRTTALIFALFLPCFPASALAAPPPTRPLITLTTSDAGALVKAVNSWLARLPAGGGAMLPRGLGAVMAKLGKLPLKGPGTLAVIRGRQGAGVAASLSSPTPAALKKGLAGVLGKAGVKALRPGVRGKRVVIKSAAWSGKWLRKQAPAMERPLAGEAAGFRVAIHLDAFVPAARGEPRLAPLEISGQLPNDWRYLAGPLVTAALKPLLNRAAPADALKLLPDGVRLLCTLPLKGLGELMKNFGASKLKTDGAGDLTVARLPDTPTAVRVGLYWRGQAEKSAELAKLLFELAKKNLPALSRSLEAKLKLQKLKGGGYALVYPITLAHRAALAAIGIKVPFPVVIQWRARGKHLVIANDPLFLKPKKAFGKELPARLKDAAARCWMPGNGRSTRLVWQADGVRMESDALAAGQDMIEQLLLSFPASMLSGMIKQNVVEVFRVPAGSMAPAILPGEHIWVDRRAAGKAPRKGDIVVFRFPRDPNRDLLKRVVALAGETVKVKGKLGKGGRVPVKVPPGHVFVMGDDRKNSFDSRHFGPVKVEAIKGRATSVLWSRDAQKGAIRWKRMGRALK